MRDAVQAGAAGYIVKPFQPEQVRQHIDACFDVSALPAEAPRDTLQRLGIDGERLLAYLTGFQGQIVAASEQVDALLARGEPAQARQQLERLHLGCRTLGLHGAEAGMSWPCCRRRCSTATGCKRPWQRWRAAWHSRCDCCGSTTALPDSAFFCLLEKYFRFKVSASGPCARARHQPG